MKAIPNLRNHFTCLETARRPMLKVCRACGVNAVDRAGSRCNPCNVEAYDAKREAMRLRGFKAKPRVPETLIDLGRAARRAGLTVADIEELCPPLSPADERLMNHG